MKAAEKGKRDEERLVVLRAVMTAKQVDALWEWVSTLRCPLGMDVYTQAEKETRAKFK